MTPEPDLRTLLALDIGNTHIVLGIFVQGELVIRRRLSTHNTRTPDEAGVLVKALCQDGGVDPASIEAVGIASVVPVMGRVFSEMARTYLHSEPVLIHGEIPGFKTTVPLPSTIGGDRVCSAIAGAEKYGGPLLILDFGTATTIDVVDRENSFRGGVIMPGLQTSASTLKAATALLPETHLVVPEKSVGTTTDECIQSGLMLGTLHALRGLIADVRRELGDDRAKVIATGGMARVMAPHLKEVTALESDLVLHGIKHVLGWSRAW